MYKLWNVSKGKYVSARFRYERSLFGVSKVEFMGRYEDFDMGDVIELRDVSDSGYSVIMKGIVRDLKERSRGMVEGMVYSYFIRMAQDYRAVRYFNKKNWEIVEALIDLYNGATEQMFGGVKYDDVDKSNEEVNIDYFAVGSRVLGEIMNLFWLSGWFFTDYYDESEGKWYAYPLKVKESGKRYREGKNDGGIYVGVKRKKIDSGVLVNKLIVQGKEVRKKMVESGTVGAGAGDYSGYGVINLSKKVSGSVKLVIDGSNVNDFKVLGEDKKILVNSGYVGKSYSIEYTWRDTKVVVLRNDESIKKYGERLKVEKTDLMDYEALVSYGQKVLDLYSEPMIMLEVELKGDEWDLGDEIEIGLYNAGEKVYNYYKFIVFEKVWVDGRYVYKLGNSSQLYSLMKDVLEKLKVKISDLEIVNVSGLDNPLNVEYDVGSGSVYGSDLYCVSGYCSANGLGGADANVCSSLTESSGVIIVVRGAMRTGKFLSDGTYEYYLWCEDENDCSTNTWRCNLNSYKSGNKLYYAGDYYDEWDLGYLYNNVTGNIYVGDSDVIVKLKMDEDRDSDDVGYVVTFRAKDDTGDSNWDLIKFVLHNKTSGSKKEYVVTRANSTNNAYYELVDENSNTERWGGYSGNDVPIKFMMWYYYSPISGYVVHIKWKEWDADNFHTAMFVIDANSGEEVEFRVERVNSRVNVVSIGMSNTEIDDDSGIQSVLWGKITVRGEVYVFGVG